MIKYSVYDVVLYIKLRHGEMCKRE